MEKIELRVVEHDGVAISHHWHAIFGMAGGTIGRSGQNKLIISDADASVARVHAMVRLDADGAFVANLSERDPIWVSDQEVCSGQEIALPMAARLRIGKYTLCAVAPGTPFAAPVPMNAMAAPVQAQPAQAQAIPQAIEFGAALASEPAQPQAPLLQDLLAMQPSQTVHRPLIPKDFDPFAAPPKRTEQAQDPWNAGLPVPGDGDLIAQRHDGMVQELPLSGPGAQSLHDASHTGLPACFEPSQTLDPLALFGAPGQISSQESFIQAGARSSELGQAFNLPRIQPAAAPLAPSSAPAVPDAAAVTLPAQHAHSNSAHTSTCASSPSPAMASTTGASAATAAPGTDLDSLARAFIEGAGLDPAKTHLQITPEFMRTFGEVLQIAVQGTIDLLAARTEIKREFRAGVTIIASGANNPFKFLPNAEGVLMQMVHQTFPGFMKPLPAMQEAYADLHVHQLALMAGIRAAYAEALARFDPSELERRTESHPGLLDKILTNSRKAALWDDYKHNFDALRRHAEDDLAAFSGRTFVDAYEQAEQATRRPS
ncbi:type VI secretion system-associated FHA domain protein TagH [Delftia sp. PS-11]|uniref:type VI secretion system-associated FHA domain protein TagH n=1 Tax=Delftia sp. PS-11 TaxID=2767222 RepID=UPI00245759B6|nr:type VI secretion system-associated FHA domain protein TagH [Delftia sp. PS-11]KAJ8743915.1 type VI secretion system-associated FHA domain protein TagH [Delftia sp. PS-11]